MYRLYTQSVSNARNALKRLGLELLTDPPELFVEKKLRFFWACCKTKTGERVFFKSILRRERGIKNRFLNEINFLEIIKKSPSHPLRDYVPEILHFSKNPSFIYLCYKFLPGKTRERDDKYSKQELIKITELAKVISSSPTDKFKFIPQGSLFNYYSYRKRMDFLLKNLSLTRKMEKKIKTAIEKDKEAFRRIRPVLTHGDFSEANILFNKNKIKLLDWEHVHLRNPVFDFTSFWVKRKKEPKEQKILLDCYLENGLDKISKEMFFKLFKLSLVELCLGELTFVKEMETMLKLEEKAGKTKKSIIEKRKKSLTTQRDESLRVLEKELS